MLVVAVVSAGLAEWLGPRIAIGARSPIEPVTVTIVTGIVLRALGWIPSACESGIKAYEIPLKLGIVLLGLSLTLTEIARLGGQALVVLLVCLALGPASIYLIASRFGIAQRLAILLGVGTTICGSTAIAVAAPVIDASDEDVSYAIATISLFGVLAMLALPLAGAIIGLHEGEFGIWAGIAVPSTPQVIGAAYMYSPGAGLQATVVKLGRNVFIIPVVFVIGVWYSRQKLGSRGAGRSLGDYRRSLPAFLFGFVTLALVRTLIDHLQPPDGGVWRHSLENVGWAARSFILVAMAGIGLNTRLGALRTVGAAPLAAAFLGLIFLAAMSLMLIMTFWIGY
jgi:uncharacterized integral membrane protein (TIGR00698 family)